MSPQSVAQNQLPEDNLAWVHIDDFSPGVYDGSHISLEAPIISAPLGAANAVGTFACASIPGGALAPLPALTSTVNYTTTFPGSVTTLYLLGFAVTPQLVDNNYEIVSIFEGDDGTNHYVKAWSWEPATSSLHAISGPTITSGTVSGFFGAPYPLFTRMNVSGSGGPPPPGPVLVFPTAVTTDSSGTNGHLWVYPEILSPTSFVAQDLIVSASSVTGRVVTYGNRVICLVGVGYSWPAGSGISTSENINYTDPPQSSTYGNQQEVVGAEQPWGYGDAGSVSVGELLLIKKYGGAVILNGDVNSLTSAIPVPGVESTGDFVGKGASTSIGFIYCSQDRGAWLWNGGNVSQKISKNIADNFFDMQSGLIQTNNFGYFVYQWNKWVMFSKNYMYDTENNAWWVLYPNAGVGTVGHLTGRDMFWWNTARSGNQLLGAPLAVPQANPVWYNVFDNTVPSPTWQWTSLPIHVTEHADRVLDVREVCVRVSDPSASGTATISVTIGGITRTSATTIGVSPTFIRFQFGAKGLGDIVATVEGNNSNASKAAPILHSLDIGYQVRAQVGAT